MFALLILHLPLPVVNIFLPILSVPSIIATSNPESFAISAEVKPAAPPPTIIRECFKKISPFEKKVYL